MILSAHSPSQPENGKTEQSSYFVKDLQRLIAASVTVLALAAMRMPENKPAGGDAEESK